MKSKNNSETEKDILKALIEMSINDIPKSQDEINALLIEGGLNPTQVRKKAIAFMKGIKKDQSNWRNAKEEIEVHQEEFNKNRSKQSLERKELLLKLKSLTKSLDLGLAYRNQAPDDMSNEDLNSLIDAIEYQQKLNNKE